jgi:PST family polysaccharide transporter
MNLLSATQRFRTYLNSRPDVQKIVRNAGWLFSDQILRLTLSLFIGAWVARYLGVEQYGLLSIAVAYLTFAAPLLRLGLDTLVVKFLVEEAEKRDLVLGTAFALRAVTAILLLPLLVLAAAPLYPDETAVQVLIALLAFGYLLQIFDVVDFWNQSQLRASHTVLARNLTLVLTSVLKVIAILAQAPLLVFGILYLLDTACFIVLLVLVYQRRGHQLRAWRWSTKMARRLLQLSTPLLLSGIAISLYMRVDQLMLSLLLPGETGTAAVGVYAVAVRLSETWYFVPLAISASLFPALLQSKKQDEGLYRRRMQRFFNLMALVSYAFALPVTFLSPVIVDVLFGPDYAAAAPQLSVLAWAGVWVSLGVARSSVLQAENATIYGMYGTIAGAFINIALNLVLIPTLGGLGCAIATFIAYGASAYLSSFAWRATAGIGVQQTRALLFPNPMFGRGVS